MKPNQPIGVRERAQVLPATCFRTLVWREGTNAPLSSRFARARVRVRAHRPTDSDRKNGCSSNGPRVKASRPDIFCPPWLQNVPFKKLVSAVKMRWRIERDYRKLKQEVGLGHYEGRNWRGFHHHASLCIAAYGFLMLEQPSGAKKKLRSTQNASRTRRLPPTRDSPRCTGTSRGRYRPCVFAWLGYRQSSSAMPMLRQTVRVGNEKSITQYN